MLKMEPVAGVTVLLVLQVALLMLSFDALWMIFIFCTATNVPWLGNFGLIHFAYLGLLVLGFASLWWRRGRLIYIALVSVALLALPAQAWMVRHDFLYCDGP
jgi:hypothetical protein